ncbi:protein kinase domain-containing protein [Zavarzinella formosa]|uniref:protein kinase domain-containing protein n=1 Tax=Zavarzinella formosa TaxID=360055 RepID=UPI0002DACAA1|nr:protein kinase [Zavarzinella formosa]
MRFGRFELTSPLDNTPAGPVYLAVADGEMFEIRSLEKIREDRDAWANIRFRLRLLALVKNELLLQPEAADLEHDPPYLAVRPSEPAGPILLSDQPLDFALRLTLLVAEAHRIGLTVGEVDTGVIRRIAPGRLALDLIGTGEMGTDVIPRESTNEEDIAWLGNVLDDLLSVPAQPGETGADRWPGWNTVVGTMRDPNPMSRPLASEVAAWFECEEAATHLGFVPLESLPPPTHAASAIQMALYLPSKRPPLDETVTPADDLGEASIAKTMPRLGDQVGRFLLLEKLGEGGMGVVFRAEDQADGSMVAVKILKPEAAMSPTSRRRFVKESRLLAKLNTPHVTRLIAADTDDELCYLAVEFVPGQNVGQYLRTAGMVEEKLALEMIADAARGLAVAHRIGIVHRDIKPENLLLLPEGTDGPRVKVTDFGLARLMVQSESQDVTRAGALLGTPRFMSPEQFGAKPVDARADVYALGATLFNLLTGQPAFPQDNLMELTQAVISQIPPAADRVNPEVSAATAALVARCLSKETSDRPTDAGMFLREIERLISGEPSDILGHPRAPIASSRAAEYVHTWDLKSTPAQLWPHVSNTERLNRAIGLPAVRYEIRRDPLLGTRRFAHANVVGFKMEWEEHPFEWIEGRRMGILREFIRGPFVWMLSVVELISRPEGGTTLRHTLRAEPRGFMGRMIAPMNLGRAAKKGLEAVYRRIDLSGGSQGDAPDMDRFELPTQLSRPRQRRLHARIDRLLHSGAAHDAVEMLGIFLANAPDQEVSRIKPLAIARRFGIDEMAMVETCLRSVLEGLLQLQWDVICPLCRVPSGHRDTLKQILEHENCPTCDASFRTDFATAVELVFRVHPDVRPTEDGMYCAGGPAHSPHVVAQVRLSPGERVELELSLSEGLYRVRGPQLPWNLELRVANDAVTNRWELNIESAGKEPLPPVGPSGQVLVLQNGPAGELIVRIERAAGRDDVLTAARAMSFPSFRELFPGELLSPGQLTPASMITLLLAQADRSEQMFSVLGEAKAFQIIQAGFRVMEAKVKAEGGVIVKTVGEGLLAAFEGVSSAVRAGLSLTEALTADPLTQGMPLRVAVHRGMAMVATVNDRLDYFGQTPRLVGRLLEVAGRNELAISATTASDHNVNVLFQGRPVKLGEVPRPGLTPVLTYVVPLEK